jgi:glycosyltransferase involved in cell wall biosynthesis
MSEKISVAVIGTNGLPGRYGGWDQLLNHLTDYLRKEFKIIVFTSSYNAEKGLKSFNDAELKIVHLKANGIQSILYDIVSMIYAIYKNYDVMLILGVSGCIFLPVARLFSKKIIVNIDGAEWKRGKWNRFAKIFLKYSEYLGVKYSDVVIADNKILKMYVKDNYDKWAELIEYGGDNVQFVPLRTETEKKYNITRGSYAFKVCRIEPENNLDLILSSFSKLMIKLIVVGNWNNSLYGIELREKYAHYDNLILLDPIYEQQSIDELRGNCGLYIHGHSVGGTNPSLVEAMSLNLCCLVYDVDYNRETVENSAFFFKSEQQLIDLVNQFIQGVLDTDSVQKALYSIAQRRYKWSVIINKYAELFRFGISK